MNRCPVYEVPMQMPLVDLQPIVLSKRSRALAFDDVQAVSHLQWKEVQVASKPRPVARALFSEPENSDSSISEPVASSGFSSEPLQESQISLSAAQEDQPDEVFSFSVQCDKRRRVVARLWLQNQLWTLKFAVARVVQLKEMVSS